jgi:hypothetical protein
MRKIAITLLLLVATGLLCGEGNPPGWTVQPMHTVNVFEGLIFDFRRTGGQVADVTVTALVDGKECTKHGKVTTPPNPDPNDPDSSQAGYGRFPMTIGGLDDLVIERVKVTLGQYTSDVSHPDPTAFYLMTRADSKQVSDLEGKAQH